MVKRTTHHPSGSRFHDDDDDELETTKQPEPETQTAPEPKPAPQPQAGPTSALKYGTVGVDATGGVWWVNPADGSLVQVGTIPQS